MKRRLAPLLALLLLAQTAAPAHAATRRQQPAQQPQEPAPQAPPRPEENPYEDEVVRITTSLVQFDAVVVDRKGQQVTDLRPEEFEVSVDGKRRDVTNFSYVDLSGAGARAATTSAAGAAGRPGAPGGRSSTAPVPPARLKPGDVRRTIALVVDDLGLSFESIARVRQSLKKFVDEQMQPGDLVAVIRTSAGVGALQQFTSDRAVLAAAIERVKWYPQGRAGVASFAPIEKDEAAEANRAAAAALALSSGNAGLTLPQAGGADAADNSTNLTDLRGTGDLLDRYREELFSAGTLGALNFVVRGLKELPGRKSVVLLSDSLPVFRKDGRSDSVVEKLRRLVDLANRASVRVYSMDARGLASLAFSGEDNTSSVTGSRDINRASDERRAGYFESQNGLSYLAAETGGLFINNTNDVAEGVREVLRDQKGFYLIGYRPDPETFGRDGSAPRFHKLEVRVTRPGLSVRTRNGFYGIPEEEARPLRRTRAEQLYGAIISPFFSGGIGVRLTSLFVNDAALGSFMRSLLHIDARALDFARQPDGSYLANIDVLAVTFGDAGQVIDRVDRTDAVRVEAGGYEKVLRSGFDYVVNVPIARPGAYQLRMAVRDSATERLGSASQFIEVPDLSGGRLTLSGLVLSGNDLPAREAEGGQGAAPTVAANHDPQSSPAVRRLRRGAELFYNFAVYNARAERPTGKPRLTMRARLYRDGREIYTGREMPVVAGAESDARHLLTGGRMSLGPQAAPGEYVLQIVVTDAPAGERPRTASQWIDFEIVE